MKKLLTLAVCALILATAGSALATIDWAGNVWPNDAANVVPTGPVDVYAQVYKAGVTDPPGQGADISGVLSYTTDIAAQASLAMTYNTDVGSNDEYTAQVPQAALLGATWVDVDIVYTDGTDASEYPVATVRYNVVDVLPNDVTVSFTMCLGVDVSTDGVCVIGDAAEIGAWGTGVTMTDDGGGLYTVDVVFAAGGNPNFEYKFQKDACATWEDASNRPVTLPTDGTTNVVLDPDSWNNQPLGCGLGDVLTEDKAVCFQVCLTGVDYTGGVCAVGNIPELDAWGAGIPAVEIAVDLYQACIILPAGAAMPIEIEYKYKKDDCAAWESVGNRLLTIDNSSPANQTMTHTWDDGPGACEPVAIEGASWGTLKGMYR
jgi:hypothetical protein